MNIFHAEINETNIVLYAAKSDNETEQVFKARVGAAALALQGEHSSAGTGVMSIYIKKEK